jgi:hypothetical protein
MSTTRAALAIVLVLLSTTLFAQSTNSIPFVDQPLVPTSVRPGSPGLTLTVHGAGFVSNSVVKWNGSPLSTTFVGSHQLEAVVPKSDLASARIASVTVSSPAPGGGTSNAVPFTITTPTKSLAFATSTIPVGLNPAGIIVADFNNDGKPDLAVVNQNQIDSTRYNTPGLIPSYAVGTISILLGNGDGTFSNESTLCFPNLEFEYGLPQLVAGDFTGDGKVDLVASYEAVQEFYLMMFMGNGDGTFTNGDSDIGPGSSSGSAIAGDFNRDGKLDLAFQYEGDFSLLFVDFGNGDGTFTGGWEWGAHFKYLGAAPLGWSQATLTMTEFLIWP